MQEPTNESDSDALISELYPLAKQASRILLYLADLPGDMGCSDLELSARVGDVSAEHVAIVRRSLLKNRLAKQSGFAARLDASRMGLRSLAERLNGIAAYRRLHKDRDSVQLVLTEPGDKSALRKAIDDMHALSPAVFQTSDVFFNLARAAKRDFTVVAPFIDDHGANLLVELFSICGPGVRRHLICRPLSERECGDAFLRRASDFRRLNILVYEYALPSLLPSGRETFHAKLVLADDEEFYVGSSNFMASALERSFECGVIVRGETAKQLNSVLAAVRSIAKPVAAVT
jgi:phosphatidylserine/phosphatidylglycerophosphate/cardiolipin synthase-like enzyme